MIQKGLTSERYVRTYIHNDDSKGAHFRELRIYICTYVRNDDSKVAHLRELHTYVRTYMMIQKCLTSESYVHTYLRTYIMMITLGAVEKIFSFM